MLKKSGKEWSMKYKSLEQQRDKKIRVWKMKKHMNNYSANENTQPQKLLDNPNIHMFSNYDKYGKRADESITSAKNAAGVTVATKEEIKEAFYHEFQQRFEA